MPFECAAERPRQARNTLSARVQATQVEASAADSGPRAGGGGLRPGAAAHRKLDEMKVTHGGREASVRPLHCSSRGGSSRCELGGLHHSSGLFQQNGHSFFVRKLRAPLRYTFCYALSAFIGPHKGRNLESPFVTPQTSLAQSHHQSTIII